MVFALNGWRRTVFELVGRLLKVSDMENISVLALPLAFSVSSIINFLWLYFAFSTKISEFDSSKILTSIVKINIAVALMAVAIYPTLRLVAGIVDMHTFAGIFLQGVSAFLVGLTVYSVVSYLLKISEFFAFGKRFICLCGNSSYRGCFLYR